MSKGKIEISWATIGTIILAISAGISGLILLINFLNSRSPQITVKNKLAFPVKVYYGDEYQGIVSAFSERKIKFYSEKVFPVNINWEGIMPEAQNGDPLGVSVTGSIEFVDNHQEIIITHTTGKNDYFMPILNNETDKTCQIYVNEGFPSGKYSGVLLPHKRGVNVGYHKWFGNSNVALYCDDGWHWWGERNGVPGPILDVQSPSGETNLTLTP